MSGTKLLLLDEPFEGVAPRRDAVFAIDRGAVACSWTWFDLGWPPHDLGAFEVSAITYAAPTGVQQIRAFVTGASFLN